MKRSKIFLGVTACILGVAAFAASKAKFTKNNFFTDLSISGCRPASLLFQTSPTGAPITGLYSTSQCEKEAKVVTSE